MSLQKQIALLRQAQRFYCFKDDPLSQKKYVETCNKLAQLYEMERNQC